MKKISQRLLAVTLAAVMVFMTPVSYVHAADNTDRAEYEMPGETEAGSETESASESVSESLPESSSEIESVSETETEENETGSDEESASETDTGSETETESSLEEETSDEEELTESEETEETVSDVIVEADSVTGETDADTTEADVALEFHVGDGYIGEYSDDDIRDYFESEYDLEELLAPKPGDVELLGASDSENISALKTAMQNRKTSFSCSSSASYSTLLNGALKDTNETDPISGDYIRGNMIGYSVSWGAGTVAFSFIWTNSSSQEEKVNTEVAKIVKELDLKNPERSDYDKVKDIHDYLVNTIDYVNDGTYHCHGTHAALVSKKCVCQGYANAFTRLTREAGIASKYIVGDRINHAWNIVKVVDDAPGCDPARPWYNMDVTWDDPIGGRYLYYTYFLKNNLDFSDHPRNSEYETASYNSKHPMALYSYGETTVGMDADNNEYTLQTIDGDTVTTTADGKPKFVMFFGTTCRNSQETIKSLAASKMVKRGRLDVIAIEANGGSAEALSTFRNSYAKGSKIQFVSLNRTDINYILSYYMGLAGHYGGYTYSLPLIIMIDENNRVQFMTEGYLSASTLSRLHMYYLKSGWDPDASTREVKVRKFADPAAMEADVYTEVGSTLTMYYGDEFYLTGIGIPNKEGISDFDPGTTVSVTDTNGAITFDPESGRVRTKATSKMRKNKSETVTFKFISDYADDVSKSVKITVKPRVVTSVSCETKSADLIADEELQIDLKYMPEITSDDTTRVTWTSSNEDVATVIGGGMSVKIKAGNTQDGEAVITAVYTNAAGKKITVRIPVSVVCPLKLDKHEMFLTSKGEPGEVYGSLTAVVTGYELSDIEWNCNNDGAASIVVDPSSPDKVTVYPVLGLEEKATADITVSTKDGKFSQTCKLTVNAIQKTAIPMAYYSLEGKTKYAEKITDNKVPIGTYITLASATEGANIYYSFDEEDDPGVDADGKPVGENVHVYTDRIRIDKDTVIKAIAYKPIDSKSYSSSAVQTYTFTVDNEFWGEDLADRGDVQSLFTAGASAVPNGLWYLIDGDKYEGDSIVNLSEEYTGDKITISDKIEVYHGTTRLIENRDYTISYANNTKAVIENNYNTVEDLTAIRGEKPKAKLPTVTIKGKGSYKDKAVFTFGIHKGDLIMNTEIYDNYGDLISDGIYGEKDLRCLAGPRVKLSGIKPKVMYRGKALKQNKDYELIYIDYAGEEIGDPSKVMLDEPGLNYQIRIRAKEGSNFSGEKTITVVPVDEQWELPAPRVKLNKVKIAGLKTKVEYCRGPIEPEDLFEPDKITMNPYGTNNPGDAWNRATLYTVDSKTRKKIPLKQYVSDLSEDTVNATNDHSRADYEVEMTNTGVTGKFTLIFRGINGNEGVIKKTITVKPYNVNDAAKAGARRIYVEFAEGCRSEEDPKIGKVKYSKAGARPEIRVLYVNDWDTDENGLITDFAEDTAYVLKEGIDYTLTYKNNTKIVDSMEALGRLKSSARPTVVIKGKGCFTGSNTTMNFLIDKADAAAQLSLAASDVTYKENGKPGYFIVIPKIMDGSKVVSAGKNKDIDAVAKTAYRYYYADDTILEDGTPKYAGTRIESTDLIPAGTRIRVAVKVTVSKSEGSYGTVYGAEIDGYYSIVESGKDISKYSAKVIDASVLTYCHGEEVIPVKETNIEIKPKGKNAEPLGVECYEIVSVTNNRFLGKATVTVRGRNGYGGVKTFTFKIKPKSLSD